MPFIRFGDKQITITPGSAEEIMQQLKDQLDAKIDAAALNAVVSTLRTEQRDGDTDTLIKSSVELIEEDPESGTHNGYVLKQGGIVLGHIHTPSIVKNAYLEKEGEDIFLVIEFEGAVDPVRINVSDLIDIYTGSTGNTIKVTVSADNVISAEVLDGTIARVKVAEDIEESLKKADEAAAYTDQKVADEKAERVAEDSRLSGLISAEESRATAAEDALRTALEEEAEIRKNADIDLSNQIDTEKNERIAADEALQAAIDEEKSARESADELLDEKIDQETADRIVDVEEEQERASAREDAIEQSLNTEITRSTAKDSELEASITAEVERAKAAEETINSALEAEKARAAREETALNEALDEEITHRAEQDEWYLDEAKVYTDQEVESEKQGRILAVEGAIEQSKVMVTEAAGTGDILKTYTITQGTTEIGKINLAKDLVVTGGSIVEIEGEKYLRLTIANQEQPVDIKVSDLVDVYTADGEYITLSDDNEISVSESVKSNLQKASTALQEDALTPYRAAADQDAIDATKAVKADTYTKDEVDALLEESGKVQDVKVNGESTLVGKDAIIKLKTVGGESITGEGDVSVNTMTVVEVLPEVPSETTLYKLTKDMTHQEKRTVIDPQTGEEIEVWITIVDFAKGLYVWIDEMWKSVLADSTAVNYETLVNKPRINGKILTGNKSAADLGLMTEDSLTDYQKKEDDTLETTSKTVVGAINELKAASSTVYKYKGSVATVDDLPSRATVGDSYYVEDEQSTYAYNGEAFLSIGGTADLSAYQKKTDATLKTTNKTVSGAINEVRTTAQQNKGAIEEMQSLVGEAPLETEAQTITEAINEIAQGGGGHGGGKMTLNGEETAVTPENVNIYAPLAGGEKSRMLVGNPLGAPTWETSCRSVTLTKAEYDDLSTTKKNDPNIIYYITDDIGAGTTEDPAIRWDETLTTEFTGATDKQIYTAKAVNTIKQAVFDAIYPIGSYAFGVQPSMGTWTQVTGDRALWLKSSAADGSTINQGLPDIQGTFDMGGNSAIAYSERGSVSGAFTQSSGSTSGYTGTQPDSRSRNVVTFKASSYNSNIYGKTTNVQPNAYVLTVWKRTA